MTEGIDWNEITEWDLKYCMHPFFTANELPHVVRCVEKVDQNFIHFADGSKALDLISGAMSCSSGLWHPRIASAIKEASDNFGFAAEMHPTRYKATASKILVEDILGPDDWAGACRWVSSGSEAVEMALNIARLYTNRPNIITREWAYHGWTLGAGSCTQLRTAADNLVSVERPFQVRDIQAGPGGFHIVPGHNCYRCSLGLEYPACKMGDGQLPCVHVIESMIRSIGEDSVAGIITEIAYGASGIEPAAEYCLQIRRMTKDLGILWIDDEVLIGAGRLGAWFGYQIYGQGATPDIMTIGKGVVSSQLPVGGVVVSREIADFFSSHRWSLAATYFAHPLVMAAVVANLEMMIDEGMVENIARIGDSFGKRLNEFKDRHRCVGQVTGRGGLWMIELVKNRETREPFVREDRGSGIEDMAGWPTSAVYAKMAEEGVLAGSILPNTLTFLLSGSFTEALIDMACEAIDHGLAAVDEMCD